MLYCFLKAQDKELEKQTKKLTSTFKQLDTRLRDVSLAHPETYAATKARCVYISMCVYLCVIVRLQYVSLTRPEAHAATKAKCVCM
jgi:hypothetical protein